MPRSILYIVVHCSATRANIPFTEEQLLQCHLKRGFKCIGYHFYVTKDGVLHHTRPMSEIGAHALGFNLHSLSICYEGGLDECFCGEYFQLCSNSSRPLFSVKISESVRLYQPYYASKNILFFVL